MKDPSLAVIAIAAFVPSTVAGALLSTGAFWWLQRMQRSFDERLRRAGGDPALGYVGAAGLLQQRQTRRRRGPIGWWTAWYKQTFLR